jgi:UDP-N-acetylmuramate--alanine ligase
VLDPGSGGGPNIVSEAAVQTPYWLQIELPGADRIAPGTAPGRVHLIGIGGIGMSGIAEVLLTLGYGISGSDLKESESTRRLERLGAKVFFGHRAENVAGDVDVVVVSSAVDEANPEVRAARAHLIPVIPRAEMLAELMRVKCGVAVAGAHGKTTTTSMVATVLGAGGFDPTVVIGGRLASLGGTNARLGRSRYMVAEADESDGSFLLLKPTIAVVTNIDREHMNYYRSMERLHEAYIAYINGIPFYGKAILCTDCEALAGIISRLKKRHTTYGLGEQAEIRATNLEFRGPLSAFDVSAGGDKLGRVHLEMPGEHAVRNALAAVAVGLEFGLSFPVIAEALAGFSGVQRRFDIRGETSGVLVVDDYGHHPTEIRAVLGAARRGYARRLVAVFQPHRYSRLEDLMGDFVEAFDAADEVLVADVYAAGEEPIEGVSAEAFARLLSARRGRPVVCVGSGAELAERVHAHLLPGDLVLTLGAGDITRVGGELLELLER